MPTNVFWIPVGIGTAIALLNDWGFCARPGRPPILHCCRPGLHRRANYLLQFLPARTAGQEHGHSVNYSARMRANAAGSLFFGRSRWAFACSKRRRRSAIPACPMRIESLANRLRSVTTGTRVTDCQAAAGIAGTCLQICSSPEELLCHLVDRGFPQRCGDIALQSGAKVSATRPTNEHAAGPLLYRQHLSMAAQFPSFTSSECGCKRQRHPPTRPPRLSAASYPCLG